MEDYIFEIILGVISIIGAVLTGAVIPYIKEKIGNEKLAKYEEWVKVAVRCAEMVFPERGMGESKKEYVVKFLSEMFNQDKTVISSEQLEVLIEAAVKALKLEESK